MESVIPSITTPLALAALVLLIFGALLGSIFKTQGAFKSATNRRVVVWIFSSVIVLSVMANISYLVQIFLFSEALLTGNVRDSESNPIKFAYVDLQAVGRTATSDDGSFQVSIPYSRQRGSYAIFSSAPGFSPYSSTLSGPRPEPRTIVLQKLKATLDNSMQFGSDVTLTQDIGIPILVTGTKIVNSIGRPHTIDDLSIALTSPSGNSINLIPIYMKPLLSQFMLLPLHPIPVPLGSNMEMAIFWGPHQQEVVSYMNQIVPKMPFHPSDFCTRVKELPNNVDEELKAVFDSRFLWRAGKYRATMSANIEGTRYERSFGFEVTEVLANRLMSTKQQLKNCFGVGIPIELPALDTLYVQKEDIINFTQVSAKVN